VDHDATVWADGIEVARHRGGFTPFRADLADAGVAAGDEVEIVVRARDPKDAAQARGKQSTWFRPTHAVYPRTTGIWQTVWLEGVPTDEIRSLRILPALASRSLGIDVPLSRSTPGTRLAIPEDALRVWGPGEPELYALSVRLLAADGSELDAVRSYAGLRSTSLRDHEFRINGEKVFQRLILDQGYWEETFMTSPSDAAITTDIRLALEAGFN